MIEQNVQVLRFQDDRLWVQMGSQSGCSACEDGKGCGAGVFSGLLRRKPVVLELPRNSLEIRVGQMVTLAIPEKVYIGLVLGSYGWPLLAALAGGIGGFMILTRIQVGPVLMDAGTLVSAVFSGYLAVRLYAGRNQAPGLTQKLQSLVYYSAANPNMCKRNGAQAAGESGL